MALMILLLICLINIAIITAGQRLSQHEKFLIKLPFDIYLGWITIATIANATVLLVSFGWDGFGLSEATWTIIILAVGALIGTLTMLRFVSVAYGAVLIWAYVGILIKHTSDSGFSNQYPEIVVAVSLCITVFVLAIGYMLFSNVKKAGRLA